MATIELDPIFVRALRLLHSQAKDSADQLKAMLDDAFKMRQGQGNKSVSNIPGVKRLKDDLGEVSHLSRDAKRLRLESPRPFKSHTPSPTPSSRDSDTHSKKSEESKSDTDDDLSMEILEMGLTCVVCKGLEVGPRNQLVECQDCHSLYHQECHKPPINEEDVNDPRVVWYCANCTKTMKKMQATKAAVKPGGKSSSLSSSSQGPPLSVRQASVKPDTSSTQQILFKRVETKSSLSASNSTSQNKPVGMAALAASLKSGFKPQQSTSKSSLITGSSKSSPFTNLSSVKTVSSSSSSKSAPLSLSSPKPSTLPPPSPSSSSNKSSNNSAGSSIHYADKRLQNMKKKAAKMKEKRKMLK